MYKCKYSVFALVYEGVGGRLGILGDWVLSGHYNLQIYDIYSRDDRKDSKAGKLLRLREAFAHLFAKNWAETNINFVFVIIVAEVFLI